MDVQPVHPWTVQQIAEAMPSGTRPFEPKALSPIAADRLRRGALKKQRSLLAKTAKSVRTR